MDKPQIWLLTSPGFRQNYDRLPTTAAIVITEKLLNPNFYFNKSASDPVLLSVTLFNFEQPSNIKCMSKARDLSCTGKNNSKQQQQQHLTSKKKL